ncbi:MAG: hypothetical protein ACKV2T_30445 [Kofleriaceae bacterium]
MSWWAAVVLGIGLVVKATARDGEVVVVAAPVLVTPGLTPVVAVRVPAAVPRVIDAPTVVVALPQVEPALVVAHDLAEATIDAMPIEQVRAPEVGCGSEPEPGGRVVRASLRGARGAALEIVLS